MPQIVWDQIGSRTYETGLDRGVLYLPDGSAVPWNGLTSIIEHFDKESVPVYFDGMKISDLIVLGSFSASMKAVTYPDEFTEVEGLVESTRSGVFYGDQPPQTFGLCYRTQVGNDLQGDVASYKLHILYNLTAVPQDKTYATQSADPSLVEFEWSITAVPEEFPGYRPTAHIVIDSSDVDPWLLEDLEAMLYGGSGLSASLIPMPELIEFIDAWYRIQIVDNGDGTWSAISRRPELINFGADGFFELLNANAVFISDDEFEISDTVDIDDVPQIKFIDNGDGSWTAVTDHTGLFTTDGQEFEIVNANAEFISSVWWQVEDTVD